MLVRASSSYFFLLFPIFLSRLLFFSNFLLFFLFFSHFTFNLYFMYFFSGVSFQLSFFLKCGTPIVLWKFPVSLWNMTLLSVVKETNTWLSMNTLIKRGQYSTVQSNTRLALNGLIILYTSFGIISCTHNKKELFRLLYLALGGLGWLQGCWETLLRCKNYVIYIKL